MDAILSVNDLAVGFDADGNFVHAADDIRFDLMPGETFALVGESGSGKSVTALSVMRLLSRTTGRILSGEVLFNHPDKGPIDLLRSTDKEMQSVRGRHVSMVFQEPMTALNPVKRCGSQIVESIIWHKQGDKKHAKARALDLFREVRLPDPERVYRAWPHELSGGQKQRVMIAMAMACNPSLLIADEPTTALDVTVQKSILELIRKLQETHGTSVLFISHDLGVVRQIADRAAVMRDGRIVEQGRVNDLFSKPKHPYTKALIACRPPLDSRPERLAVVEDFLAGNQLTIKEKKDNQVNYSQEPFLEVKNLRTWYVTAKSIWGKPLNHFKAVEDISFSVNKGETLGLVGESGCGKTTLGRSIMRLIEPRSGTVIYKGKDIAHLSPSQLRKLRPKFQIIFQDPYASLTPGISVGNAIMEPMRVHGILKNKKERKQRILELLRRVGLEDKHYDRYPHEFSGGQRQRICIARALALDPEFLICDESVSALDVSVQAQVLNLLNDLKKEFGLTFIFISHDLSVVKYMSDRIIVMKNGQVEELNKADELYLNPQSPYTRMLIDAIPSL